MPGLVNGGRLTALAAGAVMLCLASAAQAPAGGLYDEHVYADSFGNLVVLSPAGYKRIVVGRGYLAHRMAANNNRHRRPKVVYLEPGSRGVAECRHHAVLLHGRSYMYGLPDNVVPEPAAGCR